MYETNVPTFKHAFIAFACLYAALDLGDPFAMCHSSVERMLCAACFPMPGICFVMKMSHSKTPPHSVGGLFSQYTWGGGEEFSTDQRVE